jgi:hypothetical protein
VHHYLSGLAQHVPDNATAQEARYCAGFFVSVPS